MQANQITPMPMVIRSRFFSATEDPPSELDTPPEHVGESSAASLVQQDQADHEDAGEHEQDGEDDRHESKAYVTAGS